MGPFAILFWEFPRLAVSAEGRFLAPDKFICGNFKLILHHKECFAGFALILHGKCACTRINKRQGDGD